MKNLLLIFSTFIVFHTQVYSQSNGSYNLKKCIDYALENSNAIKNARIDESISKAKVGEIRAIGLPQIEGKADLIDNPKLKKSFLPAALGSFGSSGPPPVEMNNNFIVLNNIFQLRNALDANITASQLIFSSTYIVGIQAANTYKDLSQKNTQLTKINIIENIMKAYYLVLVNKSRGQLLDVNINRLDTLYKQTNAMFKNGFVEKIDVDRLEVTFQNLKVEKLKFNNINNLGYALLKFQMGMPVDSVLEIQGSIEELENEIKSISFEEKPNAQKRIEYSILETQKRLNVFDLKRIKSGSLPTLAAFGTVGAFRSASNLNQLLSGKYYDYNLWGLSFKQPIFGGFSKVYQAQQAKLAVKKSENNLSELKNSLDLQVQQSSINLKNNVQTLANVKRNMDLSSNVAQVTKIKYQQGVGSNLELIDAEASYREATTNFYNALYDALVAKIDYQKSLGKLDNN